MGVGKEGERGGEGGKKRKGGKKRGKVAVVPFRSPTGPLAIPEALCHCDSAF